MRLLVDAVGSLGAGRSFFEDLTRSGGLVRRFQPPRLGLSRARFLNFRTHRKIVVVDGCVGFTGGVNWAAGTRKSGVAVRTCTSLPVW